MQVDLSYGDVRMSQNLLNLSKGSTGFKSDGSRCMSQTVCSQAFRVKTCANKGRFDNSTDRIGGKSFTEIAIGKTAE